MSWTASGRELSVNFKRLIKKRYYLHFTIVLLYISEAALKYFKHELSEMIIEKSGKKISSAAY